MGKKEDRGVELIARGVLIERGRVLVCRNKKRGHIFLPGGHVEFGERAAEALAREMREELGATLRTGRFLGVCESSFAQTGRSGRQRHHEVNMVFTMLRPARRRRAGGVASRGMPELASVEPNIEFVWVPLRHLRGRRPAVRLLPRGLVPLILTAQAPASQRPGPGPGLTTDWR